MPPSPTAKPSSTRRLPALAAATNWVFRDESLHIEGAMALLGVLRQEYPELFDASLEARAQEMLAEAIDAEMSFCQDALSFGVTGLSPPLMRQYLEHVADQRLAQMGFRRHYHARNPFAFMLLQDVQPLTNFFERRVTGYSRGFDSSRSAVSFNEAF